MYKILRLIGDDVYSPLQNHYYGKLNDVMGKKMICEDYDDSDNECSNGFYAVEPEGLIYTINSSKYNRVFECKMTGRNMRFNEYKHRFKEQTLVRILSVEETKQLIQEQSDKMDWNYYNCVYPVNPLIGGKKEVTQAILKNTQECIAVGACVGASVWASVRDSVRASVEASVRHSVLGSVWDSVEGSVEASVWAYIGYQFPKCSLWENGVYKYQCFVDLWDAGFILSYDGKKYRLHSGQNADVVWETE